MPWGCDLTGSSTDPVKQNGVVGFTGHRGDLPGKPNALSRDACVRKVPLISLS